MAVSMIGPKFYAWDRNGKPLAFGKLYTYQARTNVPKPTYQSEDQEVENTNPVILNGEGYANIYLDGSYKMVLKDDKDNEIWSADPVTASQPTEWVNCTVATYVSPTSFILTGNKLNEFDEDRRVRIDNGVTEYSFSSIVSSVFSGGNTTVTIEDPVVAVGIENVCTSIVGPESLKTNLSDNILFRKTIEEAKKIKTSDGLVRIAERDNALFVITSEDLISDTYSIIEMNNGSFMALTSENGKLNAKGAGCKGDFSIDEGLPGNSAVNRAVSIGCGELNFPANKDGEGYLFITPLNVSFTPDGETITGLKITGSSPFNSNGPTTGFYCLISSNAMRLRSISETLYELSFYVWGGSFAGNSIVSKTADSITFEKNPWEITGGSPVTWNSQVTSTDGTIINNGYVQFATNAGSYYGRTFTDNGDSYTIGGILGANGNPNSNLGLVTRGVRFSSRAHFEPSNGDLLNPSPAIYPADAGCIFLDTAENGDYGRLWFTQVLRCFTHDLGSGAGGDSNEGNLGTYSNVIVDGAWHFMANTDTSGGSAQSLNGGHFSNLQLFSVRMAFNGRRIENMTFASLQTDFCDGFMAAFDIYGVNAAGANFGWGTGTGYEKDIIIAENVNSVNLSSSKFGRHNFADPLFSASSYQAFNLNGATFDSLSESGNGAVMYVKEPAAGASTVVRSSIGGLSIGKISGLGADHFNMFFENPSNANAFSNENDFGSPVYTDIEASKRDMTSSSSLYGYLYSSLMVPNGGDTNFQDVNTWVPVDNKRYVKLAGVLPSDKSVTLTSLLNKPERSQTWVVDTNNIVFGGFKLIVSGTGITTNGVYTFTWVGSWLLTSSV